MMIGLALLLGWFLVHCTPDAPSHATMHGLLSILIWLPIVGGLLVLLLGERRIAAGRWLALVGSLATLLLSRAAVDALQDRHRRDAVRRALPWIPRFNAQLHLGVDGISMPLILLTAFITVLVVIAGWNVITSASAQYFAAFLILEGLMIGVFAALDALLFYVFWEAMLIPMFIIIGVWGGPRRVYATIKFFLYTFIGSLLMLVALIYLYLKSRQLRDRRVPGAAADAHRAALDLPGVLRWPLRSRCRCGRCTPGCRMRTSKRRPAARWCWRPSC